MIGMDVKKLIKTLKKSGGVTAIVLDEEHYKELLSYINTSSVYGSGMVGWQIRDDNLYVYNVRIYCETNCHIFRIGDLNVNY